MKSNFKKAKSFYKKSEKSSIENHNPLEVVKTMVNELKKSMNIVVSSTGQNEQNSVRAIHLGAFDINQLTSVEIPSSVTSIGAYAFDRNQLSSITIMSNRLENINWIPDSVKEIFLGST